MDLATHAASWDQFPRLRTRLALQGLWGYSRDIWDCPRKRGGGVGPLPILAWLEDTAPGVQRCFFFSSASTENRVFLALRALATKHPSACLVTRAAPKQCCRLTVFCRVKYLVGFAYTPTSTSPSYQSTKLGVVGCYIAPRGRHEHSVLTGIIKP